MVQVQVQAFGSEHYEDCYCDGGNFVHDQLFQSLAMFRKENQPKGIFECLERLEHRAS